jgi:hypothetical protein
VVSRSRPNASKGLAVVSSPSDPPRTLRVDRQIATTPHVAWELIADVTRIGDWSPETTSAAWTAGTGGPAEGARFRGTNRMGSKKWTANCLVSESWEDQRGALLRWLAPIFTGTKDRARRNTETMTVTLERLAATLEKT